MLTPKLIIVLIICMLAGNPGSAQFFYPKNCVHPDSVFATLQRGHLNVWATGGWRESRTDGIRQSNGFHTTTINYVPFNNIELGIQCSKSIPRNQPFSYRHSDEYIPYVRSSLLKSGCFKYAAWTELSYHLERRRDREKNLVERINSPAAGFGVYKTVGRFFWLQARTEFFIGKKISRSELTLVWKMMHIRFGKKAEERRPVFSTPFPTS